MSFLENELLDPRFRLTERPASQDLVVIAIESEQHLQILRALGCDVGQGFGIGRPLAADDFAQWLHRSSTVEPLEPTPAPPRKAVTGS